MTDTRDELVAIIKAADDNSIETHRQWLLTPEQMADAIAPWLMEKLTVAAATALRDAASAPMPMPQGILHPPQPTFRAWLRERADAIVSKTAAVQSQGSGS